MEDFFLTPLGQELLEKVKNSDAGKFVSDKVGAYQKYISDLETEQYNDFVKAGISPEQARMMQDIAMMSPALGTTRAVKQLGSTVGKTFNELASKIKDTSPEATHISNLQKIRKLKANPELWEQFTKEYQKKTPSFDSGAFKNVYLDDDSVVKRFIPESYHKNEMLPASLQEQLIFNKIDNFAPKTNTYKTKTNTYQVQEKIKNMDEVSNNLNDWEDTASVLNTLLKEKGVNPHDMHTGNFGVNKKHELKVNDVGAFDTIHNISSKEANQLNQTYKTLPDDNVDFYNEIFKLRQGNK